jgi:meiotically up-regulated gene 157 (Mug157) protein
MPFSNFKSQRPKPGNRKFISSAVEKTIENVKHSIADKALSTLFENCFPNTLDTTVDYKIINGKQDTFIITGDINAMWLRDSTAQVWPYLPLLNDDEELKNLFMGVINRQTKCILLDPYANAFNDGTIITGWKDDLTIMKQGIYERKWEIDSLCYPIRLAFNFWQITGDISCFDADWQSAAKSIFNTFREQQRKSSRGPYKFGRVTAWSTDTVPGNGYGNPVNPVGLIASIFRPSDDAAIFPFHIPSNHFAVVSLKQLAGIFEKVINDAEFASECVILASEIEHALSDYGIGEHLKFGKILAYEVDGFGNKLFMDDANVPSLLSLPYLGCCRADDIIYNNTRKFILSYNNPYFFKGKEAEGIGSPHTLINMIWNISIIMRALTSDNDEEIIQCLTFLKSTDAGTGFMHEAFDKDNAGVYTREWFAWANSLFGELILKLYNEKPYLLTKELL